MLKPDVLRNKKDFTALYNKGKSVPGKYVVLFYRKNGLSYNRKAFLASKKIGKSVQRNRARRLMKESWRGMEQNLASGYDILFIARSTITDCKCQDVAWSMRHVLKKSKLIRTGSGGKQPVHH